MTAPQPRKLSKPLLILLTVALLTLAVVLFVVLRSSPVDKLRDLYNSKAAATRAATWPRPGLPPGEQALLEGAAAPDYQQAWELLNTLDTDDPGFKTLHDRLTDPAKPTQTPPTPLADSCAALGVTPDLYLQLPELTATLCDKLKAAQPALLLADTASRRREGGSPVRVTDPWTYPPGGARPQTRFVELGRLLLLQAAIDRAQGQEDSADSRLATLLRFSSDMGHGGGLVSALLGSALRRMTAAAIHEAARRGQLSDRSLKRLSDTLVWELEHRRYDMNAILADDFLLNTPFLLTHEDMEGFELITPHGSANLALGGGGGLLEGIWRRGALRSYHRVWDEQLTLEPATCAARFALSDRHDRELSQSINPLTQILAGTSTKLYEANLQLSWSQLALLLTALSELRYQRAQGAPAPNADALRQRGLPAPDDPLTQQQPRWEQHGDARSLHLNLPPELEPTLTSNDQLKELLSLPLLTR